MLNPAKNDWQLYHYGLSINGVTILEGGGQEFRDESTIDLELKKCDDEGGGVKNSVTSLMNDPLGSFIVWKSAMIYLFGRTGKSLKRKQIN